MGRGERRLTKNAASAEAKEETKVVGEDEEGGGGGNRAGRGRLPPLPDSRRGGRSLRFVRSFGLPLLSSWLRCRKRRWRRRWNEGAMASLSPPLLGKILEGE